MPRSPSPARRAAVTLLDRVLGQQIPLSESAVVLEPLAPADRAAAGRLATEVLRGMERADRLLKPHLRKAPPMRVRNVLRLGVTEIAQGGATHGVVHDCVEIVAQGKRTQGFRGLTNAVLRKFGPETPEAWGKLRVPRLPRWLRGPLVAAWGAEAVAAMEAVQFTAPPLDLTPKDRLDLEAEALPTGSLRLHGPVQVTALPGYAEGAFWVQDAAAALPVRLLGEIKGLKVLDMCAAPGGKTLQLAAGGAEVTAIDLSQTRLARVRENLVRTGLTARVIAGDALEHQGQYDAILLDAPCSATGTLRRHPDLPHLHQGEKIAGLIDLQAAMLDHALSLLKPGGRVVYATCSLLPDEGECQIEEALARHPGVTVETPDLPWIEPGWRAEEGGLRLRPDFWADRGGMDGFYMASLRKPAG